MNTPTCIVFFVIVYTTSVSCIYLATLKHCHKAGVRNNGRNRQFFKFVHRYNKHYESRRECLNRFRTFKKSLRLLKQVKEGVHGAGKYGITSFADYKTEELGYLSRTHPYDSSGIYYQAVPKKIPRSWDWRKHGVVHPVEDQIPCMASYAFGIVGNTEGTFAVKTGKLLKLSVQQVVDCDHKSDLCGNGDLYYNARYFVRLGAMSAKSYPYLARNHTCMYDRKRTIVRPKDVMIIEGNEAMMAQYLYENGPVAAYINGDCLRIYRKGIFYDLNTGNKVEHDFYILLVGYGVKHYGGNTTLPYWIGKTPLGTRFGEKGYMRLVRGNGMCQINKLMVSVVF